MTRYLLTMMMATAIATLATCAGCSEQDQVRSYTIPKEAPPPVAEPTIPARLPTGEMRWDLPTGWIEVDNTSSMRFATIAAGEGDDLLEVAVSRLAGTAGGVTANVNRWRGQVGLPPASDEAIRDSVVRVTAVDAEGLIVDLAGETTAPRMLAAIFPARDETWFIKTVSSHAAIEGHREAFVEMCESVHFTGSGPAPARPEPAASARPEPGTPTWTALPEGWTVDDTPRPMSVASITVSDGAQQAALTITPLGGRQDLLDNVNRWRRQVGAPPIGQLADDPPVAIEVAGTAGHLVDVAGAGGRTIAVTSIRGDQTWFYKLTGPDPLVGAQRAAFETFVRSIRFGGGSNG